MRVIIRGSWSDCVGTDYCDALGIYEGLEARDCVVDAHDYAWNIWSPQEREEEEDDGLEPEGPDYYVEEYDPDKHDCLRASGGSFEDDFLQMEE